MISGPVGGVHVAAAVAALVLGLVVLLGRKGTRPHRILGYGYALAMAVMLATAFLIYRLFGKFGPFHVAALVSTATLAAGLLPAVLKRPRGRWLEVHYGLMSWSYIGLVAAATAEVLVRVPRAPFWPAVPGATAGVMLVGGWMVNRFETRTLAAAGGAGARA